MDKRADIWAFGCVLFEMLTGKRPFRGSDVTDTLASIVRDQPDLSRTPPQFRRLLTRCLEKDPAKRLRDLGDAWDLVESPPTARASTAVAPAAARTLVPWVLVVGLGALALFLAVRRPVVTPARPEFVQIKLPPDIDFYNGPSLSADGTPIAFVGLRDAVRQVFTRSLEEPDVRAVPGTETASAATIAPDGMSIVFVTPDTRIARVVLSSGLVEQLGNGVSVAMAPASMRDGSIVFSRGSKLMLRTPAGPERELAATNAGASELALAWPITTAEQRTVLFAGNDRAFVLATSRS